MFLTTSYGDGLILAVEIFANFLHGDMVRCFQGSYAGAENGRHLLVLHLFIILHIEYHTLLGGQGLYGGLQTGLKFVAIEPFIGFDGCSCHIDVFKHGIAVLTDEGERLVGGYAIEPSEYLGIAKETVDAHPCLREGVLQDVIGIVVREHHAADVPIERLAVGFHQG